MPNLIITVFILFVFCFKHDSTANKHYIYNFWIKAEHDLYNNTIIYRPKSYYKEGEFPSNEGIRFRRFGRYENIRAVNKCSFTDCKPLDVAKWKWKKIRKEPYIIIESKDNQLKFFKIIRLSKDILEIKPVNIPF
ncbi:MAG: hypothetical protein HY738_07370 [Bacteroidia bacterium]|nr:hypothetical protein [Bacteroidia bacterium]